ncbi:DNA repair protein RecO [Olivibacter sitiensis]|uniref:DNA repair protein RecO n=1 Tax=Olivibacter sitiensis TaxID=376470 RepID=UPI000406C3C7|nr:DNA repair protein RecO [Olivibacter sitiensis]
MLHHTRGIVLRVTDYSESSVVVQVLTEKFGMQSYLVQGVKKPKARIRINVLQPLSLLDLVVYHKQNASLQKMAEARLSPMLQRVHYEMERRSMGMFINELLYKSVRFQQADELLFGFVYHAISWLDASEELPVNFHLYFLLRLTKHLGFHPSSKKGNEHYFDLKEGGFVSFDPGHIHVLHEPHTTQWATLLNCPLEQLQAVSVSNTDRRILLNKIVEYYRLHIENLGEINSHRVLEEILR